MMNTNLATQNTNDFTITKEGEAFISQRAISRSSGIPQSTISRWIINDSGSLFNVNEFNQLDSESLLNLLKMGHSKSTTYSDLCLELLFKISKAGAKAYIYHKAGLVMSARRVPPPPPSKISLADQLILAGQELKRAEKAEQKALAKLDKIGNHLAGSTISKLGTCVMFNVAAKIFSSNLDIEDLGHNQLLELLRDNGWLMDGTRSRAERNYPYQSKMKYFRIKIFHNPDNGSVSTTPVLRVEGMVELAKQIPNWLK